jgi:hypothetical protein
VAQREICVNWLFRTFRVHRLIARWSCSIRMFRYFDWRILMGVSRSASIASSAARLAPLLSMITVSVTLGDTVLIERFLKETPCCNLVPLGVQHKIDGVTVLVDGAIEIPPCVASPAPRGIWTKCS